MPTVSPAPMPKLQFFDNLGAPLSGGKVYTYEPGSTTAKATYTDSTGLVANTNPIILDSAGRANVWIDGAVKFVVNSSADVLLYTVDNVPEYLTTAGAVSQWQASGFTPTYLSATTFSVPGDHTGSFAPGDRIKSVNTGGTIYSTVTGSAFTTVTTVTVINDSGVLDSGLASVDLSIITVSNPALPVTPTVTKTDDYVLTAADVNKVLIANKDSAVAFTILAANLVPNGTELEFENIGSGTLTLTGTVSGVVNPTIATNRSMRIFSNGTAWYKSDPVVTATTDGTNNIKTKILSIGLWDMDATASVTAAHGIDDPSKIRGYGAIIIPDQYETQQWPVYNIHTAGTILLQTSASLVQVTRTESGFFDSTDFNSTSYNRGFITITYVE